MGFRSKTGMFFLLIAFAIVFCAVFVFGQSNFVASVSLNQDGRNCGLITSSTNILRQINATGNCFSFNTDNIILDCVGFNIIGNGSGIAVNITNHANITIKNCVFINFSVGLERINASNNIVLNVSTINSSTQITNSTITINNESLVNSNFVVSNSKVIIIDSSIGTFNFTTVNLSLTNNNSAIINFTSPITGASATSLNSLIAITNSSVFVNTASASFLNTTAHLSFLPQNLSNIQATVDFDDDGNFVSCPANVCSNAGQAGSIFEYDVAHFTTFSFGPSESPTPPSPQPSPSPASGPGEPSGKQEKSKDSAPIAPPAEQNKGFFSDFSKWAEKISSKSNESEPRLEKPGIAEKINNLFYPVSWRLKKIITTGINQKDLVISTAFILLIFILISYLSYKKHNVSLIHRIKIWWLMRKQKRRAKLHKKSTHSKLKPEFARHVHKNNELQVQPYVKPALVLAPPPIAPSSQIVQTASPKLPPPIAAPVAGQTPANVNITNTQKASQNYLFSSQELPVKAGGVK